jgi:6-pyruvoyltetrahydropterin/6-carboxytetrahydropterin synthase
MDAQISVTRKLTFCAGHRVRNHESKCKNLHGHNYVVWVTAQAPKLDALGRVVDFSVLKDRLGSWLDVNWDHGFIVWEADVEAQAALRMISGQKKAIVPFNPTAEEMAQYLLNVICPALMVGIDVTVTSIRIDETENCWAVACV